MTRILPKIFVLIVISGVLIGGLESKVRVASDSSLTTWEYHSDPALVGYSTTDIGSLNNTANSIPAEAIVVVVGGKILWEFGDTTRVTAVASVRKSILAMLYGNYVEDGTIDLNLTLEELNIDDSGGLLPIEKQATISHLLTARSGVYHPSSSSGDNFKYAPERGSQEPGSYYLYNNWDFNVARTIFEQLTGKDVFEAMGEDIAIPLGLEHWDQDRYKKSRGSGEIRKRGKSQHPGYSVYLSTRDMARIGEVMLRKGVSNGTQAIPAGWVERIVSVVTPLEEMNPPSQRNGMFAYGYSWRIFEGPKVNCPFEGSYLAYGMHGQYITVIPKLDMVVTIKTLETPWRIVTGGGTDANDWAILLNQLAEPLGESICNA